jgi:hypothetical protein
MLLCCYGVEWIGLWKTAGLELGLPKLLSSSGTWVVVSVQIGGYTQGMDGQGEKK